MIGNIPKAVLKRLNEEDDEIVLVDAEAGLEHFGRQVDKNCDLVICVVDPNVKSIQRAGRGRKIAEGAGAQTYFILNKVDEEIYEAVARGLDPQWIVATIPQRNDIFLQSLDGKALIIDIPQIEAACTFIGNYRKPLSLNMKL